MAVNGCANELDEHASPRFFEDSLLEEEEWDDDDEMMALVLAQMENSEKKHVGSVLGR